MSIHDGHPVREPRLYCEQALLVWKQILVRGWKHTQRQDPFQNLDVSVHIYRRGLLLPVFQCALTSRSAENALSFWAISHSILCVGVSFNSTPKYEKGMKVKNMEVIIKRSRESVNSEESRGIHHLNSFMFIPRSLHVFPFLNVPTIYCDRSLRVQGSVLKIGAR